MISPQTTKKSIFAIPKALKLDMFCPWCAKNEYFCTQITNSLLTHRLSVIPRCFNAKFLSGT